MKNLYCILACLFSMSIYSQIDTSNESSTLIPAIESEEGNEGKKLLESKPIESKGFTVLNPDNINGLSVPKQNPLSQSNDEEFSMFNKEQFGNPAELYAKQIKRQTNFNYEDANSKYTGSTTNQYLGDFKTGESKVNVIYRDHMYPDGDRVRVFVNDDVIIADALLHSSFSGFELDLAPGFNKIDFQALNQGDSGPNTAELQILDSSGNIIASSQWNLATGVRATLIVIKE